jgi:hypothetical protein
MQGESFSNEMSTRMTSTRYDTCNVMATPNGRAVAAVLTE